MAAIIFRLPLILKVISKNDDILLYNFRFKFINYVAGVVGQEPVLFRGTIFENIAIGCPEATLADVQRVATMSFAHEFITNLPKVCILSYRQHSYRHSSPNQLAR